MPVLHGRAYEVRFAAVPSLLIQKRIGRDGAGTALPVVVVAMVAVAFISND